MIAWSHLLPSTICTSIVKYMTSIYNTQKTLLSLLFLKINIFFFIFYPFLLLFIPSLSSENFWEFIKDVYSLIQEVQAG